MSLDALRELPIGWAVLALFCIVMVRANLTYWVGRGAAAGGRATRLKRFMQGPTMARAEAFSARWGAYAVPLSFLTIGIQTAINLSAGATRMPLKRYLPAVTLGCVMWAVIYATIGLAAFEAAMLAAARSPWALLALGIAALAVVVLVVARRRTRAREAGSDQPAPPRQSDQPAPPRDGRGLGA
ncbi:DedA family protein [Mariniluteicoccus flavus]